MPPSAFPEPTTRGLPGGSLWLTFHGLQWPYYPKTGIGVSGYGWIDTGYQQISRDRFAGTIYWLQQGRAVLRLTPTYTAGRFFIQTQAELVANKDQTVAQPSVADTDDLWVRAGHWGAWDVQVGRYEAWELYHLGMGLDLNTIERQGAGARHPQLPQPPDFYGLYGYQRQPGVGNVGVHVYPGAWIPALRPLRVELLGLVGFENLNVVGFRPTAIYDLGWLKLKWSGVARLARPQTGRLIDGREEVRYEKRFDRGTGGAVQVVFLPHVEAGINFTIGLDDHWDATTGGFDAPGSHTIWSTGGFVNVRPGIDRMLVGAGAHYTNSVDLQKNQNGDVGQITNLQTFVAVQYLLAGRLYVKLVGSYGQARWENLGKTTDRFEAEMLSARLRLMYLF